MQKESKTNKNQNNKGRKGETNMENNVNNVKENNNNNNEIINKGEINMNNEMIKIFENKEFGNVRTMIDGETVLFCASDIAKALGYKRPNDAIHCKRRTLQNIAHPQSPTKTIQMVFIPESDVYRLIINSKLPSAEKFENWVFEEVLPSIRKYKSNNNNNETTNKGEINMNNEIRIFSNEEFGNVRTMMINNEPYFVGKDIADMLTYQNGTRDIVRHVDEEDRIKKMIFDGRQNKETWIINESGLYSLILSSKLPNAKKFKRWVTSEVLPSIRKNESNNNNNEITNKGEINMNKNLQIIKKQEVLGKQFKVYGDYENPLFLAKDVAEWISHNKSSEMLQSIDEDEKLKAIISLSGQNRECWFLTEDGLYEVLMQSRKPIAKQFKKEVKKILKSIRKNGFYITDEKLKEFLQESPKNIRKVLLSIKQVKFEELRKSNSMLSSNHKTMIVEFVENLNTKVMKRCYTGSFYTKVYQRMYEDYNIDILNRKEEHIRNGQKSLSTLAFIQENEIEQFLSAIFNEYVDGKKTLSVLEYNIHKIREDYTDEYDIFSFLENLVDKYREENKENK